MENVESELASAKEALDSDDKDALKASLESLTAASHKLAEVMYQSQSGEEAAEGGESEDSEDSSKKNNDDVIDAEYSDVDA